MQNYLVWYWGYGLNSEPFDLPGIQIPTVILSWTILVEACFLLAVEPTHIWSIFLTENCEVLFYSCSCYCVIIWDGTGDMQGTLYSREKASQYKWHLTKKLKMLIFICWVVRRALKTGYKTRYIWLGTYGKVLFPCV